ncbi:hypothetical protein Clacol_008916 [Clathrus columnatus]|uniref:FMN hydroxy acid dehydrogenase domain-containing protein n=1 Tax=Clathrus columnatus TaxID=1419009 RepID=A0AAV5ARY5_9AGAM|nr:hypothetical protein Clacol_008916 [Clathrus columnatus]
MDPTNKPESKSPQYSLYQREIFKRGGLTGQLPNFSIHPDELALSTREKLNDRSYFYANSNAGIGWTDKANREAFYAWRIIPRMLVDTNVRDLTTTLFGHTIPAPILFAPIGINKLYTPKGELAAAKVAAGSESIEAVAAAHDAGAQANHLVSSSKPSSGDPAGANSTDSRIRKTFDVYTYDVPSSSTVELEDTTRPVKTGDAVGQSKSQRNAGAHTSSNAQQQAKSKGPRFFQLYMGHDDDIPGNELGVSDPVFMKKYGDEQNRDSGKWIDSCVWHGKAHTWEKARWVMNEWKSLTSGRPFVIKGIQSPADAIKALELGADGIVVSNHAGRQVDGAVGSLEILPAIVDAIREKEKIQTSQNGREKVVDRGKDGLRDNSDSKQKRMTILFDSGIRTGSDIIKAIALGADAVLVGRLYIWGLSHEGESGCRHVMKGLLADLDITCTVAGIPSLSEIKGKRDLLNLMSQID